METRIQYQAARTRESPHNLRDVSSGSLQIRACLSFLPAGKTWGYARQSAEVPSKVTLVGKPDGQRYLGQRKLSIAKQTFDMFEASLHQISVRRHSNGLSESTREMVRGKPRHGSESIEPYLLAEMRFNVFAYAVFECG